MRSREIEVPIRLNVEELVLSLRHIAENFDNLADAIEAEHTPLTDPEGVAS